MRIPNALRAACIGAVSIFASSTAALGQSPPHNGPAPVYSDWHALVGATIVTAPGKEIPNGTVVLRGDRIVSVQANGTAPAGATVVDLSGMTIYAAFIDAHVDVDIEDEGERGALEHWNVNVRPARDGAADSDFDDDDAATLRALGFAAAVLAPGDGIVRGSGSLVSLDTPRSGETRQVLRSSVFHAFGLRSRGSGEDYPRSLMGAIALIRQTLLDTSRSDAASLTALRHDAPLCMESVDELDALRMAKVATEAGRPAILLGSGLEFRRLGAVAATGLPIILPLAFPAAPAVETLDDRERTTLRALQTWEQAPTNPRRLLDAGARIALTSSKLKSRKDFTKRLQRAMRYGLEHDQALAALTTTPAELLGVGQTLGTVAVGKLANLLVIDGRLGDDEAEHRALWIRGREHTLERDVELSVDGRWTTALEVAGVRIDELRIEDGKATLLAGDAKTKAKTFRSRGRQVDISFDAKKLGGAAGIVSVNALADPRRMLGTASDAQGLRSGWTASFAGAIEDEDDAQKDGEEAPDKAGAEPEVDTEALETARRAAVLAAALPMPLGAYGVAGQPKAEDLIIRGATIWTSADAGILEDGVLHVSGGKISWVGKAADAPTLDGARTIDAKGLHLTPGLIDCHSHTGISRGVNEGTQAVTAEVRIEDVLNPDDIGWYRELAGGLTCVNQLHGSANPIGGQNNVVKLRWGVRTPDTMRLKGAPGGIKFALGENVKQSSRSARYATRYPQTRMGVEALIRERFTAARHYARTRAQNPDSLPRDLELDALAEILAGDRLVHCHSYRQDEILMLCRVAEDFGFTIGTFQHGLECYKVAEAVRKASRGASIFTDWWAYKFEVIDAIPENGAILHETGVVTSFNSDSNELARRMNVEAAKAVKYGGVAPADALKFVTLHPAMQLGIENRVGSLEVGKDADFAIWSTSPLSSMSRCLSTWIDGCRYWSADEDRAARTRVHAERQRLIQVALTVPAEERKGERPPRFRFGNSTIDNLPGDCGCCDRTDAMENQR